MAKGHFASYGIAFLLLVPGTGRGAQVARVKGGSTSVTPEEIEHMLGSQAAPEVVAVLMRTHERDRTALWDFVMGEIERGDPQWLRVAVLLSPGRDAAVAEDLVAAEAEALHVAPALVLTLFGADVCFIPDVKWPESVTAYRQELARRMTSVRSIHDPALKTQKDQCLKNYVDDSKYAEEYYANK